ncbi:MAG: protease modulator HflC, partial [Bradyrhizobium sp.]|nr:protease modulator HflC [Bradyrhizobium sp.]
TATGLYAQAYGQDPHFYSASRTLEAYRAAFGQGKSRLVLTPDDEFLRYLTTPPTPADSTPGR